MTFDSEMDILKHYQTPKGALKGLRDTASMYDITGLADHVLAAPAFGEASGSVTEGKHHHGCGGLAVHTFEVYRIGSAILRELPGMKLADHRDLFIAALFHDFGKILDYGWSEEEKKWYRTLHGRQIHHIPRSAIHWDRVSQIYKNQGGKYSFITPAYVDYIMHAILAHHGRREWGSPVSPDTSLAWVLHLADMASARTNELIPEAFPLTGETIEPS